MVYVDKFVAVVISNGKILRENDGIITLPFNSEYSILLKNLNNVKAKANIHIDGRDVLYGSSVILGPNSQTEVFGFLQGVDVKNRFKFIQKTSNIQDYRGDKIDDGIIRVEFSFEKTLPKSHGVKTIIHETKEIHHYNQPNQFYYHPPLFGNNLGSYYSSSSTGLVEGNCSNPLASNNIESNVSNYNISSQPQKDEGITVEGSRIDQHFNYGTIGNTEESNVIIIRMKGTTQSGVNVTKPVTVQTKLVCPTCGKNSKSNCKFCSDCGTNLEI